MRILTWFLILIFTIAFLGVGNALYESDNTIDIYNITSKMEWNSSKLVYEPDNITNESTITSIHMDRIFGITYKIIALFGYTVMQVAKTGTELGFNNPHINISSLVSFLPTFLYVVVGVLIMVVIFKLLPIVLALTYLMYAFAKNIIQKVKEKVKEDKENKK